ncbi:hypothetical protein AB0478_47560 [Streptomyces sp. NPDC051917]|uniref:hypothetical protein n=1 Tax=Streptomyces sp. NPDC051917 TaxID=3154754 RepID=UPI0034524E70
MPQGAALVVGRAAFAAFVEGIRPGGQVSGLRKRPVDGSVVAKAGSAALRRAGSGSLRTPCPAPAPASAGRRTLRTLAG